MAKPTKFDKAMERKGRKQALVLAPACVFAGLLGNGLALGLGVFFFLFAVLPADRRGPRGWWSALSDLLDAVAN